MQQFAKTLSTSSVSRVLKDEAKWRQKHVEIGKTSSRSAKRTRILCSESINTLVAQRCQQIEKSNGRLSEALTKQIGQHLMWQHGKEALGLPESFQCGDSWFDTFCQRYSFRKRARYGEANKIRVADADEIRYRVAGILQEKCLTEEHVFNMDETALFWRRFLSTSLSNANQAGSAPPASRWTLVLCANGDASLPSFCDWNTTTMQKLGRLAAQPNWHRVE